MNEPTGGQLSPRATPARFRSLRFCCLSGLVSLVLAFPATPAGAAARTSLAEWEMNESPGTVVLHDSSGNGIDGQIGSAVQVTGHGHFTWTNVKPNEPPPKPERLIQIDDSRLNPGAQDYAVEFRYRTTRSFGNIMQKGQATTAGGQWKVQLPKGYISCLFRGADGKRSIKSAVPYNDGQWHTVRCERTATSVTLTIDGGAEVRRIKGPTGQLANKVPMTIGGKLNCDQITTTCDYFAGDIDYVRVLKG